MRKTLRVLTALMSVAVAAVTVIAFAMNLGDLRMSGERSSGAEYSILRNALVPVRSKSELEDQFLRNRLVSLYKGSERLLAAQVVDGSGLVVWKIPAESSYFAMPNDENARSGFSAPEFSTVVYTTPLDAGFKLSALYATLRISDVKRALEFPLYLILGWALILALLVAALYRQKPEAKTPVPGEEVSEQPSSESAAPDLSIIDETEEAAEEPESRVQAQPFSEDEEDSVLDESDHDEEDLLQDEDEVGSMEPQPEVESRREPESFEENLARLEEEIIEWSSQHGSLDSLRKQAASAESSRTDEESLEPNEMELEEDLREEEELRMEEQLNEAEQVEGESGAGGDLSEELSEEEREARELLESAGEELEPETAAAGSSEPAREAPAPHTPQAPAAPLAPAGLEMKRSDVAELPMSLSISSAQLEARLADELARGGLTETSLVLVHCSIGASDPAAIALAVTVRDYVGSKDLVFELYRGGFAVVLPSVDLGGALKMSEDLSDVLAATMGLYRDIEGEAPVFIGISARSSRKIDSAKLYREASTAVHKAFADGRSRILAFRPKPL